MDSHHRRKDSASFSVDRPIRRTIVRSEGAAITGASHEEGLSGLVLKNGVGPKDSPYGLVEVRVKWVRPPKFIICVGRKLEVRL